MLLESFTIFILYYPRPGLLYFAGIGLIGYHLYPAMLYSKSRLLVRLRCHQFGYGLYLYA
jgi:hypothetical protein